MAAAPPAAAPPPPANRVSQMGTVDPVTNICDGCDPKNPNMETFIKNIWNYILGYNAENGGVAVYNKKVILWLLRQAKNIMAKESTVLELTSPITVIGPIHGQGDSIVTLISINGKPPEKSFLFLGNYTGMGFAPHETLFLILALKVRFPKHVWLLKGYHEDADVLKNLDFVAGLQKRKLISAEVSSMGPEALIVWQEITEVLAKIPLAACLNQKVLCMQGGPGPLIRQHGLSRLRTIERPPINVLDKQMTVECMWSCLMISGRKITDGMPVFTDKQAIDFCRTNKLQLIVRGRQLVDEGFLNIPKQVLTITSAAAFLDNFRNCGAVINFKKDISKITVIRYRVLDAEPASLDDNKPTNGRNAIPMP